MRLTDLVTDAATGRVSHTKLWRNVAFAVATLAITLAAIRGTLTADLFVVYLGVVAGSATAASWLSFKHGTAQAAAAKDPTDAPRP